MKQNIDIKTKTQSQIGQGIGDVPFRLLKFHFDPIFSTLPMAMVSLQLGRDGPPGRARSPGICLQKVLRPVSLFLYHTTMIINILIPTKIQLFITNINSLLS